MQFSRASWLAFITSILLSLFSGVSAVVINCLNGGVQKISFSTSFEWQFYLFSAALFSLLLFFFLRSNNVLAKYFIFSFPAIFLIMRLILLLQMEEDLYSGELVYLSSQAVNPIFNVIAYAFTKMHFAIAKHDLLVITFMVYIYQLSTSKIAQRITDGLNLNFRATSN